jgi:putative tryptophan/tyrosine transport system substrate-binding protein
MVSRSRRHCLTSLAGLLVSPLVSAHAHTSAGTPKRLGMLFIEPQLPERIVYRTISARLGELGWVEGKNLSIEPAFAEADSRRLAELAEQLVKKGADVIFADDVPSMLALKTASSSIPIVFYGVPFPVEAGHVASLTRPGSNLTGVATTGGGHDLSVKRVEILREVVPKARRLGWIVTANILETASGGSLKAGFVEDIEKMTAKLGFQTRVYFPATNDALEEMFKEILAARTEALSVGQSHLLIKNRQRIVDFALRHRLPGTFFDHTFVQAGGLLSYGPDFAHGWRLCASYIDRIFRGARPADMPVELPAVTTLHVNLRTARAMGLSVPESVIVRASHLIR